MSIDENAGENRFAEYFGPAELPITELDIGTVCEGYEGKCTAMAHYIVHLHLVDHCRDGRSDLDSFGDVTLILCQECLRRTHIRTGEMIGTMYEMLDGELADEDLDTNEEVVCHCQTCGRRVLDIHDVFSIEKLWEAK